MIALLLALVSAPALADDLEVPSKVTAVTVFRDQARVTRTVKARVPAGRTDLVLDGLPGELLTESLSVEGEGNAGATLLGVNLRPVRGTAERDARIEAIVVQMRALDLKLRAVADVVAQVKAELGFVLGLAPKAPAELEDAIFLADDAPQQLATLAGDVRSDAAKLLAKQRAAEITARGLTRERDALQRQLDEASGQSSTDTTRIGVGLDAKQAGEVTLRVSYLAPGASWSPHYDARFDVKANQVKLVVSGDVVQQTGEDWEGVSLVLSTAEATQRTSPPELTPFWLNEGYNGSVSRGVGAQVAVSWDAPRLEDVSSDGTRRRVRLEEALLETTVRHLVVPRRALSAYLVARGTNTSDRTLVTGTLSSYLGSAYVGEGVLPSTPPGQTVEVSFGVDDRVKVTRKRLLDSEGGPKALGNKERVNLGFETVITNRTGAAAEIFVTDQVPASQQADFVVKAELSPAVTVPSDGVFTWELTLADGKSQTLSTRYEVTWPQGDAPVLLD